MISVPWDGYTVIEESDLTPQIKQVYSRAWAAWEVFSEDEGIDPRGPSDEDIVTFVSVATGLTERQRYEFCNGVVRVFKEVGMEGCSKSDAIKELRSELRSLFLGGVYAPAAVGGRSVVAYERWVRRFVAWCEDAGKSHLPADVEDVVAFLEEMAEDYSKTGLEAGSTAISRYQREHGFPGTGRYPAVLRVLHEAEAGNLERGKPAGAGTSLSSSSKRKYDEERWKAWWADRGKRFTDATGKDVCDYLQERAISVSAGVVLESLKAIRGMYEAGTGPTECDEVEKLASELSVKRSGELRKRAYRRVARGRVAATGGRLVSGKGQVEQEALDLMLYSGEEMPPELTDEHVQMIKKGRAGVVTEETLKGYWENGWKPFRKWCLEEGIVVEAARPEHLEAYVHVLSEQRGLSPDVVALRLRALVFFYDRLRPGDNPARGVRVGDALTSVKRKNPKASRQMSPIREEGFWKIAEVAQLRRPHETERQAIIRGALDIALISLMLDGLLRLIEAACARWADLQEGPDGTGVLNIPRSKNDQEGKGASAFVSEESVVALNVWRDIQRRLGKPAEDGDLIFGLCRNALRYRIKDVCEQAGLVGRFGGHSCRIGGAQDLTEAGATLPELLKEGRWENLRSLYRYIRHLEVFNGPTARLRRRRRQRQQQAFEDETGETERGGLTSYGVVPPYVGKRI